MLGFLRPRRPAPLGAAWPSFGRLRPAGLCEVCRRWAMGALCADCVARHAAPRPRCASCARPLPVALARCTDCLREPPPFERVHCAVDYGFPWDRLLAAFKYDDRVELAGAWVRLLQHALSVADAPGDGVGSPGAADVAAADSADTTAAAWPEVLLPVPLSPARLRRRGYNQSWELARRLAAAVGRPASVRALARVHDAPPQASLSRAQRRRNLRGAFAVERPSAVAGRRVVLVDDVLTTGATAAEAAATLRAAGAAAVRVWVVARTA